MKFSQLAQTIAAADCTSLTNLPNCDPEIVGVAAIEEASSGSLSYVEGAKFATEVSKTAASALICAR
ncbi:MAG: hypothetical protein HC833_01030 [Leptolyngbyaceae cyanobacterium RM1_406_9]|nr:hypothetical protein [Leptolyngbyaceae cyanobacterium RM1_406_9]